MGSPPPTESFSRNDSSKIQLRVKRFLSDKSQDRWGSICLNPYMAKAPPQAESQNREIPHHALEPGVMPVGLLNFDGQTLSSTRP